ncbi:MAG: polysaccharide biosynthesis protein, partial [Gammaproteobacteria bacterium]|nr:polysaccharide biosynthesis protein [Gammaproteobacteria bacterium]
MNTLSLLKRKELLFEEDTSSYEIQFRDLLSGSRVLVIGGAGTIGQATSKEIFKRDPAALHIVDISENNMVELVRDIRSTLGYGSGDFRTFAIDCGSKEFEALIEVEGPYDYIFNLSALKHVRSEK